MKRILVLTCCLLIYISSTYAQCPIIKGAMVNSCASGPGEGVNEFIVFTTTASDNAGDYTLYYGSNNPPTTSPTGHLSGLDIGSKTGTGNITSTTGCTINQITSGSSTIPAGSIVIFIPADFDQQYDVSGLCGAGSIYVVYINRGGGHSTWAAGGVLANQASGNRYLQITTNGNVCTSDLVTYHNGWSSNSDGNSVWWDNSGNATYNNNGCSVITPPVQTVTITPSAPLAVCAGTTSTTMAYTSTGSPDQYSITWNAAALTAGFANVSNATLTASPLTINIPAGTTPGTYTGSLIATSTSIPASSTPQNITVIINANTASINLTSAAGTDAQTKCTNSSITDITYAVTGGTEATVTGLPNGVAGNYSSGVFTISGTPTITGTFNYIVTAMGTSCGNAISNGTIIVLSGSTMTPITGNNTICVGTTTALSNATPGGTWSIDNGNASVDQAGNVTGNTAGTSTITYSLTTSCGVLSTTFDITIASITPVTKDTTINSCRSVTYSGKVYTNSIALKDTLKSISGCDSIYHNININIQPVNAVTQSSSFSGCSNVVYQNITYTSSTVLRDTLRSVNDCDSIYHIVNINVQNISPVTQNTTVTGCSSVVFGGNTYTSSTTLRDTLQSVGGCDSIYHIVTISIDPSNFILNLSTPANPVNSGTSVTITTSASQSYTITSWQPINIFNSQTATSQTFTADTSTHIHVIATSSGGCTASADLFLVVNKIANDFFVPTAFSPNGDAKNDFFKPYGSSINKGHMRIFSQWGQLLFESDDITIGWNGAYKGIQQPVGVYVYAINVTLNDGKSITAKGSFNLIH